MRLVNHTNLIICKCQSLEFDSKGENHLYTKNILLDILSEIGPGPHKYGRFTAISADNADTENTSADSEYNDDRLRWIGILGENLGHD